MLLFKYLSTFDIQSPRYKYFPINKYAIISLLSNKTISYSLANLSGEFEIVYTMLITFKDRYKS